MCGICGKISYSGKAIDENLIRRMCDTLAFRGPDDSGVFLENGKPRLKVGFGHQRLSIIDLSAAGRQPMCSEDESIWLTYNGEIYNFKTLRNELERKGHQFKSHTDTEVLLHLYEEEGVEAVTRLNGMFAFALWDKKQNLFWLCRDRIGIKPLVYYWDGTHFVFASEIKALLCDPAISKEIDFQALQLYLAFSYIPAPLTIFKNVYKLNPGHSLILKDGQISIKKYWEIDHSVDSELSAGDRPRLTDDLKQQLQSSLGRAVKDRMVADVPLGAFLSGGIDSSIIVALMARQSSRPIQTFSIGFKDDKLFDETPYAREVAELYRTDHHEFKLTHQDMLDVFAEVMSVFDEPFSDSSAIPTFIVSRETRRHVTVALSGDGGDELFAGYRSYLGEYWRKRYLAIPLFLREHLIEKTIRRLPDSRDVKMLEYIRRLKKFIKGTRGTFAERILALKEITDGGTRRRILSGQEVAGGDPALIRIEKWLARYQGDPINTILYADVKESLPSDMLTKVDWMSMKNALEVRVPFLDHRVVELAFCFPGALKIFKGQSKYILKETFKKMLPKSLQRRPKAGFEVPISRWLRTDLKFLIDRYLDPRRIRSQAIFDADIIGGLVQAHLSGRSDTSWSLWNLIVFQYWYDAYYK